MKGFDKIILVVVSIIRAIMGLPTQEKYEEATNNVRPIVLSRRVINGTLSVVCVLLSALAGIDIPEDTLTQLMDAGSKLYDAAMLNKPLALAFWTALMAFVGHITRKK